MQHNFCNIVPTENCVLGCKYWPGNPIVELDLCEMKIAKNNRCFSVLHADLLFRVLRLCTPQMCLPVFLEDTWPTWHVLNQLLWRGMFYSKLSLFSPLKAILGECDKGYFLGQWKWLWFWDILVWEITYCNQSPEFYFLECVKTALKMVLEDTHFIFIYLFIFFIYFCFIDYTNAFDCVDHNKLWKILLFYFIFLNYYYFFLL